MNEKSKKFALIGDLSALLGFVASCAGIACGILERYRAGAILLGGGVLLFAVAAFAVLLVKKGGVRQEEEKTSAA